MGVFEVAEFESAIRFFWSGFLSVRYRPLELKVNKIGTNFNTNLGTNFDTNFGTIFDTNFGAIFDTNFTAFFDTNFNNNFWHQF